MAEQPSIVRLVVEGGPRGCLLTVLIASMIAGIGIVGLAAVIHLLSRSI